MPAHLLQAGRLALLGAALVLAGCAGFSPDGGLGTVQSTVQPHLPPGSQLSWARSDAELDALHRRAAELLARPLTADAAVQLALVNNRGLQARLQDLGITEAEVVQATRLPNPGFSFGRSTKGDEVERERSLHLNLARLLALPLVTELESRRLEQVRREVALDVLRLAADTRRAWVQAVAARESVRYMQQVQELADAGAELARRMEQAGNFNKLARAREQAFYAEASLGLARAEQAQRATRERLVRLLGLWGDQTAFVLPDRLPELPATPRELPDVERLAMAQRLDLQALRLSIEQTARNLGLTRTTRFVNVLELGVRRNGSNEGPVQRGWEIAFELPLFDGGGARVARAEGLYRQALDRAAQAAVEARSEVREAYFNLRSAWDIARHHRDELVPLKKRIGDEQLLRYNGMLIGVFELLADARSQIAAVNAAIEALRDFWLAQVELDAAMVGRVALSAPSLAAAASEAAPAAGH